MPMRCGSFLLFFLNWATVGSGCIPVEENLEKGEKGIFLSPRDNIHY